MQVDGDVRAYEALTRHARGMDLAAITQEVLADALSVRSARRPGAAGAEARADLVARLAGERALTRDEAVTPSGNALDVLGRGPEDAAEGSLARALAAHAFSLNKPAGGDETTRVAGDLVWLAAHTPFDATGLLDVALGDDAAGVWAAMAESLRRLDHGAPPSNGRAEALVAASALALATGAASAERASLLAAELTDPRLAHVLATAPPPGALAAGASPPPTIGDVTATPRSFRPVVGEVAPAPRGPLATAFLGLTGLLLVTNALRLFGRLALAYRKPAELALSDDGGVRVTWRVELLGRVLRDGDVLVPRSGLAQAGREVRFSGVALYAGLLALVFGSYVGASAFVDGVRSASPALLATGIVIVALGLGLDFVFSCAVPAAQGRCRVLLVPRSGRNLCVGNVETTQADALLARLAGR